MFNCAYYWAMAAERGPDDVHLAVGPINHDAPQITNLAFLALFGGRLVFSPSPKPGDILEYLEEEKHRGKAGSTFLDVNDPFPEMTVKTVSGKLLQQR